MIKDSLQKQVAQALKSGDSVRVSTLRLLYSALHNEQIDKMRPLIDEEEMHIVRRQIKQRGEAEEAYSKAGRVELADKEKQEALILKEFLPEEMSEEAIGEIVDKIVGETGGGEFGRVMGAVMKEVGGRASGNVVSKIVSEKLRKIKA